MISRPIQASPTRAGLTRTGLLPLLLLVSALGACSSETPTPAATPTEAAAPAAAAAPTAGEPAATDAGENMDANAEAGEEAAVNNNPVVPPQGPAPVAGTDYVEIAGGQPFAPALGKVEVVEVFNHVCPACANFQPSLSAWKAKLPADVSMVYVPAPFGGPFDTYAHSFYAAQALGVEAKSHDALYRAIHIEGCLKGERGRDTPEDIAGFYKAYGVDPKQFVQTMNSFAIKGKLNKAKQFMMRSGVEGTPTLIVNGKYRITGGRTRDDQLRIADHLIAMERAAMQHTADAGGQ